MSTLETLNLDSTLDEAVEALGKHYSGRTGDPNPLQTSLGWRIVHKHCETYAEFLNALENIPAGYQSTNIKKLLAGAKRTAKTGKEFAKLYPFYTNSGKGLQERKELFRTVFELSEKGEFALFLEKQGFM